MKANEFARIIKNNKLESFYIFTGDERARINRCIRTLPFNKVTKVGSIESLVRAYTTKDIFNSRKLIVYEGTDLCAESLSVLNGKSDNMAIVIMDKVDKRKKEFKSVGNRIVEFEKMPSGALLRVVDEMLGVELDEKIVDMLINRCNNDLGRVENECSKLKSLIRLNINITEKIVDDMISPNTEDVAFSLVNAIVKKDKAEALKLVNDLTVTKESPVVIILLLYRQFRNIMIIQGYKDDAPKDIAMKTGLNVNMIYAVKGNTGRYTLSELAEILKILNETDVKIKRGELDMSLGLDIAILKILNI